MKPKIYLLGLLLCTACTATFAQKGKPAQPVSTTVHLSEAVRTLLVENDVTVVLTDEKSDDVIVEGDARDVKALRVQMDEGRLSLSSSSATNLAGVKVYVPATRLAKINLQGKSILRATTTLQNPTLKVILDGEGIVNLSSTGKLVIEGTADFDFVQSR